MKKNLEQVYEQIQQAAVHAQRKVSEITLVAVSKGESLEAIRELYSLGVRDFGENRVQELLEKKSQLPEDIRWHFIGKLQKNKVAKLMGHTFLIHSVDTPELAEKISAESKKKGIVTHILLEANTSQESSKSGLTPEKWKEEFPPLNELEGIEILGLMTMAPLTEDESLIRHTFSELRYLSEYLKLNTLSMGMSNDFPIAIQEGATLLRIGTVLFH